ncbi:MAG: DNA polymerase III subunit delta [Acutalibacteraceae bacterium]|jgi:DNA polymerase-3 subunit delta
MSYYRHSDNAEDIAKEMLKNGVKGGFYFIHGDENFLKVHYAKAIAERNIAPDFMDFNLRWFDGATLTMESLKDAVEAVPLFSEYTAVLVHDLNISKMDSADAENLITILEDIPESCVVVFLMSTVTASGKSGEKNSKSAESSADGEKEKSEATAEKEEETPDEKKINYWKKVEALAKEKGASLQFMSKSQDGLVALVRSGAKKRNCSIDYASARYLIECVGQDIANLQTELDKVCSFSPDSVITMAHIDSVTTKTLQARAFDMAGYLTSGKPDEAFKTLDSLLVQKNEPLMILGALVAHFTDIYRTKLAMESGKKYTALTEHFNYKNAGFRLKKAAEVSAKLTVAQISACLDSLNEADEMLKRLSFDERSKGKFALEKTLSSIFAILQTN